MSTANEISNQMIFEKLVQLEQLFGNLSVKPKVIKENQVLTCDSCKKTTYLNAKGKEAPIKRKNRAKNCTIHGFCRPCWIKNDKFCKECPETPEVKEAEIKTEEVKKPEVKKPKKTIKKVTEEEIESEFSDTESEKQMLKDILDEVKTLKTTDDISNAIDNLSD